MKARHGVLLLFFMLWFPLTVSAQVSQPFERLPYVTEEEARQFIDEYAARFMKLDLDAFMALFSKEATENRMLPYADIQEAYRRTIAQSQSIQYQVKIYTQGPFMRGTLVSGWYKIVQVLKGEARSRVFQGNIQWILIRENGLLKVREVNYGRDR